MPLTGKQVLEIAADAAECSVSDMLALSRKPGPAGARHGVVSALLELRWSTARVGKLLGLQLPTIRDLRYKAPTGTITPRVHAAIVAAHTGQSKSIKMAAAPKSVPWASVVTASGITIRRCPQTHAILWHPNDLPFAALYAPR